MQKKKTTSGNIPQRHIPLKTLSNNPMISLLVLDGSYQPPSCTYGSVPEILSEKDSQIHHLTSVPHFGGYLTPRFKQPTVFRQSIAF